MKATVVGAQGFIGKKLCRALKLDGFDVSEPDRREIKDLQGKDLGVLYYCAGKTSDFLKNPSETVEAHVGLISKLLNECRFSRVIYLSSTRLYDRVASPDRMEAAIREDENLYLNPLIRRHLYDITKAAGESICLAIAPEKTFIARLSCVWDTDDDATGFIGALCKQIRIWNNSGRVSRTIEIDTASNVARHYIHIDSVIGTLRIMGSTECQGGIYSLASDSHPTSNKEIFSALEHTYNIRVDPSVDSKDKASESESIRSSGIEIMQCPPINLTLFNQLIKESNEKPKRFIQDLIERLGGIVQ